MRCFPARASFSPVMHRKWCADSSSFLLRLKPCLMPFLECASSTCLYHSTFPGVSCFGSSPRRILSSFSNLIPPAPPQPSDLAMVPRVHLPVRALVSGVSSGFGFFPSSGLLAGTFSSFAQKRRGGPLSPNRLFEFPLFPPKAFSPPHSLWRRGYAYVNGAPLSTGHPGPSENGRVRLRAPALPFSSTNSPLSFPAQFTPLLC